MHNQCPLGHLLKVIVVVHSRLESHIPRWHNINTHELGVHAHGHSLCLRERKHSVAHHVHTRTQAQAALLHRLKVCQQNATCCGPHAHVTACPNTPKQTAMHSQEPSLLTQQLTHQPHKGIRQPVLACECCDQMPGFVVRGHQPP
jgi:hypothetical protein